MKTTFQIPRVLQQYCDDKLELQVKGDTVAQLLNEVNRNYPALYVCICDETGSLRRHINLFVNGDLLLDRKQHDKRLESGDIVSVFQAVSGG